MGGGTNLGGPILKPELRFKFTVAVVLGVIIGIALLIGTSLILK